MAIDLLTIAGFASFFTFGKTLHLWLLLPAIIFSLSLLKIPKGLFALSNRLCFSPYASGLLLWPMRIFYWDRFDFANRFENLLILAGIFSIWLIFQQQRWWGKIRCNFNSLKLKKRLWVIFIVSELLFIAASAMITRKGVALVGDEPHYLAISQSLVRDFDLNVFNQYFRGGFKEFLAVEKLPAHGTFGKGYKKLYSYHLPGLSFTLAPFFLVKKLPQAWLYFLMRSYLGIFGALLAVLVYLFCLKIWRRRDLAFYTVMVFTLTVPVFFYSFHIFPEIQAMLLILASLYLLLFAKGRQSFRFLFAGLLLGASIFWGVKYALFIYPFTLGFSGYWLWKKNYRSGLQLLIFPLLFQALFFYYLYCAYGSFSPNSVYYGMLSPDGAKALYETILNKITLTMRWETLLDYFFDQRDGLLLYNPFYFFAFPGLLLALKNFKRYRLHLLVALPAFLFVFNHAFSTIRPGYCPQGRYLTPVIWALLLFALIYYRESRNRFFKKAFLTLPLYALFVTIYQTLAPFTLYQPTTHDTLVRTGLMFQKWSSTLIDLPALLPSFIKTNNQGYLPNAVFLAFFLLLAVFALTRGRAQNHRWVGRLVTLLVFMGIFSISSLFPRPDRAAPQQLLGTRNLPCQIYFNPAPAPGETGYWKSWAHWYGSGKRCRMRIETLVPLKMIEIGIKNRSALVPLEMTTILFDKVAAHWQLQPGAFNQILLDQPGYKKNKGRYNYQFDLQARSKFPGNVPEWVLGLILR